MRSRDGRGETFLKKSFPPDPPSKNFRVMALAITLAKTPGENAAGVFD
jgi:hypothetical protein